VLIIDNAAVTELLTMSDCIRVQEEASKKFLMAEPSTDPESTCISRVTVKTGISRFG
jgi:hypothetical protein